MESGKGSHRAFQKHLRGHASAFLSNALRKLIASGNDGLNLTKNQWLTSAIAELCIENLVVSEEPS
jgi:hypothetical protein